MVKKKQATSQELADEVARLREQAALLHSDLEKAGSTFSAEARAIATFLERVLPNAEPTPKEGSGELASGSQPEGATKTRSRSG